MWACSSDKPLEDLDNDLSKKTTSVQVTALDGLVSVNSLFTFAVFIGMSVATPGQKSLEDNGDCDAGKHIIKSLLVFEVASFSAFLFSSLIAQGLKLAIIIDNAKDPHNVDRGHIDNKLLRIGMLASALASVVGCVFLMLSMVNVIQIRLGILSCGASSTVKATATLIALVTTALVIYISTVFYAFTH